MSGKMPAKGMHKMPSGKMMSDAEHKRMYNEMHEKPAKQSKK